MQVALDVLQGDVHDRRVEHDHQLAGEDQGQHQAGAGRGAGGDRRPRAAAASRRVPADERVGSGYSHERYLGTRSSINKRKGPPVRQQYGGSLRFASRVVGGGVWRARHRSTGRRCRPRGRRRDVDVQDGERRRRPAASRCAPTPAATATPLLETAAALFEQRGIEVAARGDRPPGQGRHRHAVPALPDPRRADRGRLPPRGRRCCAAASTTLLAAQDPDAALAVWMRSFAVYVARKRGMATALKSMMGVGLRAVRAEPHEHPGRHQHPRRPPPCRPARIRSDADPGDLLRALSGICMANDQPGFSEQTAPHRRPAARRPALRRAQPRPCLMRRRAATACRHPSARRDTEGGSGDAVAQVGRRHRRAAHGPQRDDAGPAAAPATSSGGSSGQPSDTFSDHRSIGRASTRVAASSRGGRAPDLGGAPGQQGLGEHVEGALGIGSGQRRAAAEQHRAAVVHRRLERRAGDDQPVEGGHRDRRGLPPVGERPHPRRPGRAVQQHPVAVARDRGRAARPGARRTTRPTCPTWTESSSASRAARSCGPCAGPGSASVERTAGRSSSDHAVDGRGDPRRAARPQLGAVGPGHGGQPEVGADPAQRFGLPAPRAVPHPGQAR